MSIRKSTTGALDLHEAAHQAKTLLGEIRKGTQLLREGKRILTDRRFQLGQLLRRVRESFPASGKAAAGWGRFLQEVGIAHETAVRYIGVAAEVEARPELADRRSYQELYLELRLAPPVSPGPTFSAGSAVPAENVVSTRTRLLPAAHDEAPGGGAAAEEAEGEERGQGEVVELDQEDHKGRPPLPERERRTDIFMVRLNTEETLRLRRLSGVLILRDAEVFREGLLALEREQRKNGTLPALPPDRKAG